MTSAARAGLTVTQQIFEAARDTGNSAGIVAQWKANVEAWANGPRQVSNPDAAAVRAWLPLWQARPLYTAAELAPIWPMLAIAIGAAQHIPKVPVAASRLANEMSFAGFPSRTINGEKFFAVERLHRWRAAETFEWEREIARA